MAERSLPIDAICRFLNALNDGRCISVKAHDKQIAADLNNGNASEYIRFPPGWNTIAILTGENKILSRDIEIEPGKSYNIAVTGTRDDVSIILFENEPDVPAGEAKMRFLHLSMDTPSLDVAVKERDVVFHDVSYQQATHYLGLTPMTVDLELRAAGSKHIILHMPKLQFKANKAYTLVFSGNEEILSLID